MATLIALTPSVGTEVKGCEKVSYVTIFLVLVF